MLPLPKILQAVTGFKFQVTGSCSLLPAPCSLLLVTLLFNSYTKSRLLSQVYHCFTVLQWIVIIETYLLASRRNSICLSLSSSFSPVLVLILRGISRIFASFLMIIKVFSLSLSKALHHQEHMTFLAGHQRLSSSQEKKACCVLSSCLDNHQRNFQFSISNFQFMEYFC